MADLQLVDNELEAKILGLSLSLDIGELTPVRCYRPPAERVALLATVAQDLTSENAIAVTCTVGGGQQVETIVNSDTMEHCTFDDPITFSEESLCSLVEAQFEPDG